MASKDDDGSTTTSSVGRSVGRSVGQYYYSSIMGSYSPTHALQHQQKNKTQTINCSACNKKVDNQQYIIKGGVRSGREAPREIIHEHVLYHLHADVGGGRLLGMHPFTHTTLDTTHCYPLSREDDDSVTQA